jgi:hypothetical protein
VLGFDPETKGMRLESVHPGVTVEEVVDATGFELMMSADVRATELPSDAELTAIRERVDPSGKLLKAPVR